MRTKTSINGRRAKITILVFLIAIVTAFHFLIPTDTYSSHKIHIVLRKLYFLPPVVAAAWFGLRGAAYTTMAISIFFIAHIFIDWPENYMEQANQIGELVGFWVVGLIPGYLFDRQRSLLKSLASAHEETLFALVSALDMREHNTRLHSQRVRDYTFLLADRVGMEEERQRAIGLGALLHDVGKIAIPDDIFLKPENLSEVERRKMREHPIEGYNLLKNIGFLKEAAEIVYSHHERFDGTGYPRGLKGEEIPLGARLFMVSDVFDALTSNRPYQSAISYEKAAEIIREKSGNHFDPEVVKVFQKIQPSEWEAIQKLYSN